MANRNPANLQKSCSAKMTGKMVTPPYPFSLEEELKRNPDLKMSDLQMLREWCEKQQHLPQIPDLLLVLLLHSNYYRMEAAKATVENYYFARTHIPEFFADRDPLGTLGLRKAFKVGCYLRLQGSTKSGHKAVYTRFLDEDPSVFSFNDCIKYAFMFGDLHYLETGCCKGYEVVADATGLALGHLGRINIMGIKKFLFYIQEAFPLRLKKVHFINAPAALEVLLNMAKPFIKKELMELLQFHSSLETLEKFISLECLPNEAGGQAGNIHDLAAAHVKLLEAKRHWFIEDEAESRINESLRIGKSKAPNDLFGVEGSFKKLEID